MKELPGKVFVEDSKRPQTPPHVLQKQLSLLLEKMEFLDASNKHLKKENAICERE